MGYMTDGLTFNVLREANAQRVGKFTGNKGQLAHAKKDGSDWTPAQWLQAMIGELGEYANVRKKYERGDISEEEFKALAGYELADVMIYFDLLCTNMKINLGEMVVDKFNLKSREKKLPVFIRLDGYDWTRDDPGER